MKIRNVWGVLFLLLNATGFVGAPACAICAEEKEQNGFSKFQKAQVYEAKEDLNGNVSFVQKPHPQHDAVVCDTCTKKLNLCPYCRGALNKIAAEEQYYKEKWQRAREVASRRDFERQRQVAARPDAVGNGLQAARQRNAHMQRGALDQPNASDVVAAKRLFQQEIDHLTARAAVFTEDQDLSLARQRIEELGLLNNNLSEDLPQAERDQWIQQIVNKIFDVREILNLKEEVSSRNRSREELPAGSGARAVRARAAAAAGQERTQQPEAQSLAAAVQEWIRTTPSPQPSRQRRPRTAQLSSNSRRPPQGRARVEAGGRLLSRPAWI